MLTPTVERDAKQAQLQEPGPALRLQEEKREMAPQGNNFN